MDRCFCLAAFSPDALSANTPMLLRCGHTLCKACVIRVNEFLGVVKCHAGCDGDLPLAAIRPNFALIELLKLPHADVIATQLNFADNELYDLVCDECGSMCSTHYFRCKACKADLCKECNKLKHPTTIIQLHHVRVPYVMGHSSSPSRKICPRCDEELPCDEYVREATRSFYDSARVITVWVEEMQAALQHGKFGVDVKEWRERIIALRDQRCENAAHDPRLPLDDREVHTNLHRHMVDVLLQRIPGIMEMTTDSPPTHGATPQASDTASTTPSCPLVVPLTPGAIAALLCPVLRPSAPTSCVASCVAPACEQPPTSDEPTALCGQPSPPVACEHVITPTTGSLSARPSDMFSQSKLDGVPTSARVTVHGAPNGSGVVRGESGQAASGDVTVIDRKVTIRQILTWTF